MSKFIIMAEEGERSLLDKACVQTGFDLGDAQVYNVGYAGSANFDIGSWVEVTEKY